MKKYITIDDKLFQKGLIIRKYEMFNNWHFEGQFSTIELSDNDITNLLDLDIIKEIHEPKWTDDDMIEFVRFIESGKFLVYKDAIGAESALDQFKKSKQ